MLITLILLTACSHEREREGIISEKEMQKILWDIIQADQFNIQFLKKDSAKEKVKEETMKLYDEIFQIHHVSREQFKKSYQYYINHPEITKPMLDTLAARANLQRTEMYKRPTRPETPVVTPKRVR
jgi:hypothetical protein